MQLQNMRYNDCAEFIADVPPELDSFSIPRLTFQPIVENALLHGIMMKEEKKGTIPVSYTHLSFFKISSNASSEK